LHRPSISALALIAVALVPAGAQAKSRAKPDVTVMSRNLYLGADIITLATAPDVNAEMEKAKALHATVVQTNFALRAKAIAAEVKRHHPDVIGLQEVARYYKGADGVHDGIDNARTPIFDWLGLLQKQLKAKKLHYKAVSRQDEIDVEVPSADGYDLRLVLGNSVLVRTGKGARVKFLKNVRGIFTDQLSVPLASGQAVNLKRGYAGMDGRVAGKRFRFLDPHAEAYSAELAGKQFAELLTTGAKSKKVPTIMAGDFNSDPAATGGAAAGYENVINGGFKETGRRASTCCQDENLLNPVSRLDQWIDHIVVRPAAKVLKSVVVGAKPTDRIGGLWPSDHAGVVAKLRLKK
jgi:endonuclease/exonuclease/phosphatase family metal-dependent hydrolase